MNGRMGWQEHTGNLGCVRAKGESTDMKAKQSSERDGRSPLHNWGSCWLVSESCWVCSAVTRVMSHLCRPAATLLFISGAAWAPLSCVWAFFGVPLPLVCMQLPGWVCQNGEQPLVVGIVGVCIAFHSMLVVRDMCANRVRAHVCRGHSAPLLPGADTWRCHRVSLRGVRVSRERELVGCVSGKGQGNPDRVRGEGAHRGHGAAPQQSRSGFRRARSWGCRGQEVGSAACIPGQAAQGRFKEYPSI